ncbi:MAG: hypothetical protein Fur0039_21200 [Rhodocyclaceae bacterium]
MPDRRVPDRARAPKHLSLALALIAALAAVSLWSRPLIPIDETRYVSVAWEMWVRGDFLVPFKNGEPYSHKPPLLFWLIHLGWVLFGVSETWPRLVSPLAAGAAAVLTLRVARGLWPERPEAAARAPLILSACVLWAVFSGALMFDLLLADCVLIALLGLVQAARGRLLRGWLAVGAGIGLGLLTKGPVVLLHVLPVAAAAPWWAAGAGLRLRQWFGGLAAAVLLGALIALAWAIPAGLRGGETYRDAIFWGQTANRMVESFAHRRSIAWYLPVLPIALFPWFAWPPAWRGLARLARGASEAGARFCLAWIVPVFVAFSLISGKQAHYLLPLFPGFALLAARALEESGLRRHDGWLPGGLLAAAGLGLAVAPAQGMLAAVPGARVALAGALMIVAGGAAALRPGPLDRALGKLAAGTAFALAAVFATLVKSLGPGYDVGPMAARIRALQDAGHPVANLGSYHDQYQFPGRLVTPLVELRPGEMERWLDAHPDGWVVAHFRDPAQVPSSKDGFVQALPGAPAALLPAREARSLRTR